MTCPKCKSEMTELENAESHASEFWKFRCPGCGRTFVIEDVTETEGEE